MVKDINIYKSFDEKTNQIFEFITLTEINIVKRINFLKLNVEKNLCKSSFLCIQCYKNVTNCIITVIASTCVI